MLGAVIGDIIGSRFEANPVKTTEFDLFTRINSFTDDTVLTIAIARSVLRGEDYGENLSFFGNEYPYAGYGGTFMRWLAGMIKGPYGSWGNGSAMRVSPVGWAFNSEEKVLEEARKTAIVTHDHPEGIKGAQTTAISVFLARKGYPKKDIKDYIQRNFEYNLERKLSDIRRNYSFEVSCQRSVPESIIAFLESENYESSVRNAVSLGGDTDTMACISGAIAEAYYKNIPEEITQRAYDFIPGEFVKVIEEFRDRYVNYKEGSSSD
jgi:ADP-ribosylglycohydrolase